MAYLGVQPTAGQYRKLDDISGSFNGSTVTFTTQVGGQNVTAGSAQSILVSLGGVVQSPGVDYTVSTNSITFTTAPASGLSFFAILMGEAINIGTPADGSVTGAKLSDPFNFDSGTLYLDGANNRVGIGTTSPSALLNLKITGAANASTTDALILDNDNSNSNDDLTTGISWKRTGNDASQIFARIGSIRTGTYDTALAFSVNNGGTLSERVRLDTSGRLLVGTSSARSAFFNSSIFTPRLQIEGTTYSDSMSSLVANGAGIEPYFILGRTRGTSLGGTTVVNNGDTCGVVSFQGSDGTELVEAASITVQVDGSPGANDMPGRMIFLTTADGASGPTERVRITAAGDTGFYNASIVFPNTNNAVSLGGSSYKWTAVWAVNGTIQTSDGREKTEVTDASLGSDFIKSLRPVSYKWIEGGQKDTGERDEKNNYIYESVPGARTHWGFIAQEVKEAVDAAGVDFGGWVLTDKDDPDSQQALRYDQFIAPLTKALQEALAKIETLEAKVAALESA